MTTLIATIILLGVLIFIHELGHYLAARSIGVRVERFSIGYPPRLMTFTSIPDGWEFRLFFYRKNDEGKLAWGPIKSTTISRPGRKGSGTEYCFAVIPFGGAVITNDIQKGCKILRGDAEELKVQYGSALAD